MTITAGIDVGTGAVKVALFSVEGDRTTWLARHTERVRQRDPLQLAAQASDRVLEEMKILSAREVAGTAAES